MSLSAPKLDSPDAPHARVDNRSEWARVQILAHCLNAARAGQPPPDDLLTALQRQQTEVEALRREPAWLGLEEPLSPMARDALACVLAPEVEPRIGWLFQRLQNGQSPYPSAAFIQELLATEGEERYQLQALLGADGELAAAGLLAAVPDDAYQPLRATPTLAARLTNRPAATATPPGARRVTLRAGWDDLVLPPRSAAQLREFIYWIRHRDTVVRDWGGLDTGGPIMLFSGPSGTGKTFAAAVIANELGWPLYRVDLGALVSKYIGETEKNLNRLFDAAHGQPMLLQFDEADALMGKRGEVKEARDRYANLEVSHLLARIERHHGPCILTTNLREHLDNAFLRRFQVVVEFPRPDADARGALWDRLLPPRAPRRSDVDTALLGAAVNLTGGQIRNAALHAAYLAAADEKPVCMTHLACAVHRELAKVEQASTAADLGPLGQYLPKDTERQS